MIVRMNIITLIPKRRAAAQKPALRTLSNRLSPLVPIRTLRRFRMVPPLMPYVHATGCTAPRPRYGAYQLECDQEPFRLGFLISRTGLSWRVGVVVLGCPPTRDHGDEKRKKADGRNAEDDVH